LADGYQIDNYTIITHIYATESDIPRILETIKLLAKISDPSYTHFEQLGGLLRLLYKDVFCPIKLIELVIKLRKLLGLESRFQHYCQTLEDLFINILSKCQSKPRLLVSNLIAQQFTDSYSLDVRRSTCDYLSDAKRDLSPKQNLRSTIVRLDYDIQNVSKRKTLFAFFNILNLSQHKVDVYYKTL
jgi:hypothetical protein